MSCMRVLFLIEGNIGTTSVASFAKQRRPPTSYTVLLAKLRQNTPCPFFVVTCLLNHACCFLHLFFRIWCLNFGQKLHEDAFDWLFYAWFYQGKGKFWQSYCSPLLDKWQFLSPYNFLLIILPLIFEGVLDHSNELSCNRVSRMSCIGNFQDRKTLSWCFHIKLTAFLVIHSVKTIKKNKKIRQFTCINASFPTCLPPRDADQLYLIVNISVRIK